MRISEETLTLLADFGDVEAEEIIFLCLNTSYEHVVYYQSVVDGFVIFQS
jgi:hypothetical protein